jgi:hypothetical protein
VVLPEPSRPSKVMKYPRDIQTQDKWSGNKEVAALHSSSHFCLVRV